MKNFQIILTTLKTQPSRTACETNDLLMQIDQCYDHEQEQNELGMHSYFRMKKNHTKKMSMFITPILFIKQNQILQKNHRTQTGKKFLRLCSLFNIFIQTERESVGIIECLIKIYTT